MVISCCTGTLGDLYSKATCRYFGLDSDNNFYAIGHLSYQQQFHLVSALVLCVLWLPMLLSVETVNVLSQTLFCLLQEI